MSKLTHKEVAQEFLTLVAAGKVSEAYERHVGTGFRHHNPYFRGDAPSLKAGMQESASKNPNKVLEIQCALQDGNEVAIFSHLRQNADDRGAAVVHIFRFEGDRIAEFWDIGQAVPEDSVNENGMF